MGELLPVSFVPGTREVLIWPSAKLPDDTFGRRNPDGSWVFGVEAVVSADELKDRWERMRDAKLASTLIHEARAAFSSANPIRRNA